MVGFGCLLVYLSGEHLRTSLYGQCHFVSGRSPFTRESMDLFYTRRVMVTERMCTEDLRIDGRDLAYRG